MYLFSSVLHASSVEDYYKGVEYFKKADYQAAIVAFEAAEKKGMASAALYYNLGSAYFKLGNYPDSEKYFRRVTEYPDQRPLAEYNLGLIALKLDNRAAASEHFEYAKRYSSDKKIVDASKQKIDSLKAYLKPWGLLLIANFGYDDNISVTPDNIAVGIDDSFLSIYANADFLIHGERKRGWLVDARFFRIDYDDSDNFNQDFYTIGLRNEHRFGDWKTVAHLRAGESTFGDQDLQSFYKLDLLGAKSLPGNQGVILQYRFDDFNSENPLYDYLEGWRQRAQLRYTRNTTTSTQQAYYELELNNRGELVTSLFSYEYSPTRHTLGGKYIHKFSNRWYLTGDLSYRFSDFPASATVNREDERWRLDLLLDYRIDSTFLIKSQVKTIDNVSTVDFYTYDKTVISLGLSKRF
jgi:tetratricopeptide (TPR) repeat protein